MTSSKLVFTFRVVLGNPKRHPFASWTLSAVFVTHLSTYSNHSHFSIQILSSPPLHEGRHNSPLFENFLIVVTINTSPCIPSNQYFRSWPYSSFSDYNLEEKTYTTENKTDTIDAEILPCSTPDVVQKTHEYDSSTRTLTRALRSNR